MSGSDLSYTDSCAKVRWYALQVRTNREKAAASYLEARQIQASAPTYSVRRRWADRYRLVDLPLFPGYIFCRCDWNAGIRILATPGVLRVLGYGGPTPLPDHEVENIQRLVRSGVERMPLDHLCEGDEITILEGPLRGVRGVLTQKGFGNELVCSVTLLQRSVAVKVPETWVVSGPRTFRSQAV